MSRSETSGDDKWTGRDAARFVEAVRHGSFRDPAVEFEAFVGGYEAAHDGDLDLVQVRVSYEEWKAR